MKNKYIQPCRLSLVLLLTTFLFACGGGSSSNNETDEAEDDEVVGIIGGGSGTTNTPGTGTCVSITSPKAGDTSLIKNITIVDAVSAETDVRTTYTAVSNTSWTYESKITSGGGLIEDLLTEDQIPEGVNLTDITSLSLETTETFTIANNFIDFTKSVTTSTDIGTITTTYSPPRSAPINEVCEGQVYTQEYIETIASLGGIDTENVNVKSTIEAVNVQKSAPAGTFNTFQVKSVNEAEDTIVTAWVDIASSTIVIMEIRNEDGELVGTGSLISQ